MERRITNHVFGVAEQGNNSQCEKKLTGSFKLRKNIYKFGEKSSSGKRKSFFATLNYNNGRMELQQKQNENITIVLE